MTLATHLRVTTRIIAESGVRLSKAEKAAMLFGSILPDMYLVVKRHYGEDTAKNIKYHLKAAHNRESKRIRYCLQIGMILHYTCDYFCKAHSYKCMFSFMQHWAYEKRLAKFIKYHINNEFDNTSCEVMDSYIKVLEGNHENYLVEMSNAANAYVNDLKYSLLTCEALMNKCFA